MLQKTVTQAGRTMVEALAYISLMCILTASFAALVTSGYNKYRESRMSVELTDLKKVITQRYVAAQDYSGVSWHDLCAEKIGPSSMLPKTKCEGTGENKKCKCADSDPVGKHAFSAPVYISPEYEGALYSIYYEGVPQNMCVQLGSMPWGTLEGSDLERLEINGKSWSWENSIYAKSGDKNMPADLDDIAKACKEGFENKIKWYFS